MRVPEHRALRVLHCPWNVAGQSATLAAAERERGFDSRCIVLRETGHGFPADESLTRPNDNLITIEVARYRLLWRALVWADVVHFSFGQSCLVPNAFPGLSGLSFLRPWRWPLRLYSRLVWLKDLPLLRAAGKAIFVTWQGDDARQGDRSRELFEICIANEIDELYYPAGSDSWKRRTIACFGRYADGQYALNPDLLRVLPKGASFLPYASFDPEGVPCYPLDPAGLQPLRIIHAPSHRGAKGTKHILIAVERLRAAGFRFDFEVIEGLPRDIALKRYATADIVIDQLLAGWYGGLGVEAMALGKVLVSYIREDDLRELPAGMASALPVVNATPTNIEGVLRELIRMPRVRLAELGARGHAFVNQWHQPSSVAQRTTADYSEALERRRSQH